MARNGLLMIAVLVGGLVSCTDDQPAGPDASPFSLPAPLEDRGTRRIDSQTAALLCHVPAGPARCRDGYCRIPAGCFMMGSPAADDCREDDEVRHAVTLSLGFLIAETEVTQVKFHSLMGYDPSAASDCGPDCPVESVSWHQSVAYSNALSKNAGLELCYTCAGEAAEVRCQTEPRFANNIYSCGGYRLPTEAEWEYAYRAGSEDALYNGPATTCFGEDERAGQIGWYRGNAGNAPHPVRLKQPNAWGLYDMAGNIQEWIHDGYAPYPTGQASDPVLPVTNDRHSIRGGSWSLHVKEMRAADRSSTAASQTSPMMGFRPARSEL